jgi:archaellum component FlaC
MSFDLVKYRGHPSVIKEMSLFMRTEQVDPSKVDACSERAKKAEKETSHAKGEVAKLKDLVTSMNREVKNIQANIEMLKEKAK